MPGRYHSSCWIAPFKRRVIVRSLQARSMPDIGRGSSSGLGPREPAPARMLHPAPARFRVTAGATPPRPWSTGGRLLRTPPRRSQSAPHTQAPAPLPIPATRASPNALPPTHSTNFKQHLPRSTKRVNEPSAVSAPSRWETADARVLGRRRPGRASGDSACGCGTPRFLIADALPGYYTTSRPG